jgi:3-methylfumaryl-CoA hydratase
MDATTYKEWIGRTETLSDVVTAAPIGGLAALLDYSTAPWPAGEAPPLSHWFNL